MSNPFILKSDNTVFVDCDDTLCIWDYTNEQKENGIKFNNYGYEVYLVPHKRHIESIKLHKARGHRIVVWSAGGWEWALEVVKTLQLTEYVDVVLSKPKWFYDDLSASSFMPEANRIWKKDSVKEEIKECNPTQSLDELEDKYIP